eukprot:4612105-Heterocapsa_arctica.AAC.1
MLKSGFVTGAHCHFKEDRCHSCLEVHYLLTDVRDSLVPRTNTVLTRSGPRRFGDLQPRKRFN